MKLFAITESYQWYKGADATHWGVYKSFEEARLALIDIIKEKFDYIKDMLYEDDEEAEEKAFDEWINSRFVYADGSEWEDDDDDSVTKFYIDETELAD